MMTVRSLLARSLVAALALLPLVPTQAHAQAQAQPMPAMTPAPIPTPSGTPVPYPAYGSPAPDVAAQQQHPGVPAAISLAQAVDIAAAQSPAFASQRAQYRAIAAKYGAEKGALFPSVSANASITREYGAVGSSSNGSSGSGTSGIPTNSYFTTETARATLSQLVFDGGRVIAGIRSAKEADVAGRDTLIRDLQTLAFNVATAYYGVLQARASVDADTALVHQFETQENVVTAQIRTGAAARSDLAAAQFQTAQARGALVTAQGAEIAAESTFATTLGLDADTAVAPQPLGASPPQIKTLSYPESLAEALHLRPDYLAAQHTVDSSNQNLRFAKLARFPAINLDASSGTTRTMIPSPSVTTPYSGSGSLGATVSIPIYDQGLTNYNVAVAASQLDQADAALTQARLTVQSDVRGALANLISARQSLVQADAELQSARVNSQATAARYKVGAATITDIVTANAALSTAARDQITAQYNERLAEERYSYALGASDLKL